MTTNNEELSDFAKKVSKIKSNPNLSVGDHEIVVEKLYPKKFMIQYTNFNTINNFFDKLNIHKNSELEAFPEKELDKFVSANTKFNSWKDMQETATTEYLENELDF